MYDREHSLGARGEGTLSGSRIEVALELFDRNQEVQARGRLSLEGLAGWRASGIIREGKKLRDRTGRDWYDPAFDDEEWDPIDLPDDNAFGDEIKHARYYRSHFRIEEANESLSLVFSSDDGIWIYLNGRLFGHWGAKENQPGCVNDPLGRCGINGTVEPVLIPGNLLRAGDNVIAVKVNNGDCCFTYFNLLITHVKARFLPATPLTVSVSAPTFSGSSQSAGVEPSVAIPDDLRHATLFIRFLLGAGVVVQSVRQSHLDAMFKGANQAALISTNLGVVEVVVLGGATDAEQITITYKISPEGAVRHRYMIRGWPENGEGTTIEAPYPVYFTLHEPVHSNVGA